MNKTTSYTIALAAMSSLLLSACDWVDSAGSQGVSNTEVFVDGIPLMDGEVIVANEGDPETLITSRQNASNQQVFTWSDEPIEQGALDVCSGQNGFNVELAADTLQQACQAGTNCQLEFQEIATGNDADVAQFNVQMPILDASIGLRYELTTQDGTGTTSNEEFTFCLIAINDAPEAVNDTFAVIEGAVLEVTTDSLNLLSNDSDDTDVSNTGLQVLAVPGEGPQFAAQFELGSDGSFTYQSSLAELTETQFDTFRYALSDGVFLPPEAPTALVTIRIVASNEAPVLLEPIDMLEATEGEPFSVTLAGNFVDPENGEISFSLSQETPLAAGTGLALSETGELEGTPTAADVGSYQLLLQVSDGSATTEQLVSLEVFAMPLVPDNSAPVFVTRTVFNQIVSVGEQIEPVMPGFIDADGDVLLYSTASTTTPRLPPGVTLNTSTGVVSGTANVAGVYRGLRVRATDPSGLSALSGRFTITVLDR